MSLPSITPGQRRVLSAIATLTKREGIPPTLRELLAELGLSGLNGVREHMEKLEAFGCLRWRPRAARSVVVTDVGHQVLGGIRRAVA